MQGRLAFVEEPLWPRKRSDGLFFGLFPDARASRRIGGFADRLVCQRRLEGRRIKDERLHVSLQLVGDYARLRPKFVYAARRVGDVVSLPPFEVTFRSVASFEAPPSRGGGPPQNPLVLLGDGAGLFEIHGVLGDAMRKTGLRASETFVPHITLLYGPCMIPRQAIDPIRFMARELVLVHSERGLTRYHVLGRWPLEPQSAAEQFQP